MKGSFHTFKTTGDIFYLEDDMKCKSSYVIYVVICSTWNEEYMGETGEEKTRVEFLFEYIARVKSFLDYMVVFDFLLT